MKQTIVCTVSERGDDMLVKMLANLDKDYLAAIAAGVLKYATVRGVTIDHVLGTLEKLTCHHQEDEHEN